MQNSKKTTVSPACRKADVIASLVSNVMLFVLGLLAGIGLYEITHKSARDCDERLKDKPLKVVAPSQQTQQSTLPNNFHFLSAQPVKMQVKVSCLWSIVNTESYFNVMSGFVVVVGWVEPLNVVVSLASDFIKVKDRFYFTILHIRHQLSVNNCHGEFFNVASLKVKLVIVSPNGSHGVLPVGCFKVGYNGQVYEPCLFGTIKLTTAFNRHGLYTML